MKDYLNEINEKYPIRRTNEQKNELFRYVKNEAENSCLAARVETFQSKHNNIVIGDVENARVICTAHYDTPARSLLPNLMMPRSKRLSYLYALGVPILIAMLSLWLSDVITVLVGGDYALDFLLYLVLYFGAFFGIYRCGTNKHNKNDNTSGVATVLSIMSQAPKGVAYILFDNEEKGLLGSKAYNKANKEMLENKLMINFDCVGNGDNIIIISKEKAESNPLHSVMKNALVSKNGFNVSFFPMKGSMTNTDSKSFENGISVMACKRSKSGIFYTPNIHTVKDTEASSENIYFLAESFSEFSGRISEGK